MKKYIYEDGFARTIRSGYIDVDQMKEDEAKHGELVLLVEGRILISPIRKSEQKERIYGKTRTL